MTIHTNLSETLLTFPHVSGTNRIWLRGFLPSASRAGMKRTWQPSGLCKWHGGPGQLLGSVPIVVGRACCLVFRETKDLPDLPSSMAFSSVGFVQVLARKSPKHVFYGMRIGCGTLVWTPWKSNIVSTKVPPGGKKQNPQTPHPMKLSGSLDDR